MMAVLDAEILNYFRQFLNNIGVKKNLSKQFCEVTAEEYLAAFHVLETGSIRLSCPVFPDDRLASDYADSLAAV